MIERQFVAEKLKEYMIQEYVGENIGKAGLSNVKIRRTPLGEKIIISASRPGLIVGRKGANIKTLTGALKHKFKLENPQLEIAEVEEINLDARIVAEHIGNSIERFGLGKFKAIGHRTMSNVMRAGALGVEILMSGKIPSSRAKRWRFYSGYLKKCGDASNQILTAYSSAKVKTGTIGIQVRIMPPDLLLPDRIIIIEKLETQETEKTKENAPEVEEVSPTEKEETAPSSEDKSKPEKTKEEKSE